MPRDATHNITYGNVRDSGRQPWHCTPVGTPQTAVDLFSGAGGASLGLVGAGYDLRLAADVNIACGMTHTANLPGEFITGDLRDIDAEKIMAAAGLTPGSLDVLFAGPPCQGFSIIGARVVWDERNNLFREVLKIAAETKPRCIVIENVPGLANLAHGAYLRAILEGLRDIGYAAACAELLAAQYGAPQMRWRLIIIAWRNDLGIAAGRGFPQPIAGTNEIGDLLKNVTITPQQTAGFVTAREAIADLPRIAAGEETTWYTGPPVSAYQQAMRRGLSHELHNHYAARLSQANLARLELLSPGQDWRDLPHDLLPAGMQRALRKDHTRRYRRMTWDGIPRSVITRFRDPKSGEYTHPDQDRTISIREAARLQGFPDRFIIHGDRSSQYEQIGNAVPVQLAEAIAREVRRCLDGEKTASLHDPFRRRPVPFIGEHGQLTIAADPGQLIFSVNHGQLTKSPVPEGGQAPEAPCL
jgi:DNA (cytosine-5)-methyltransferase 1